MLRPKKNQKKIRMDNVKKNIKSLKKQLGHFKQGKNAKMLKRRRI